MDTSDDKGRESKEKHKDGEFARPIARPKRVSLDLASMNDLEIEISQEDELIKHKRSVIENVTHSHTPRCCHGCLLTAHTFVNCSLLGVE